MDPQQTTQLPPTNPPLPPPKPHSKLPLFLGILFLSLFILVGSYFIFGTKNTEVKTPPTSRLSPTAIPTTDPTANWKTYTNGRLNFIIRYPYNWKLEEDSPIKPDVVISDPNNYGNLVISPITEARFTSNRNREQKLLDGKALLFADRPATEYREEYKDEFTNVFVRDIQIKNINGLNWTLPNEISYWVDKSQPELVKTFDQILSTFKFTE